MKTLKAIFVAISFLISITAFAGERLDYPITVDLENGVVSGSMWGVRSSDDDVQMIGCGRVINDDEGWNFGYCQAFDTDGVFVGCAFFDEKYFNLISSINAYSYIQFEFDGVELPGWGEGWSSCTALTITAKSSYLPFTPTEKEKSK